MRVRKRRLSGAHADEGATAFSSAAGKLLAVSFSYAPANTPRAVQIGRLLSHLSVPAALICAAYDDPHQRSDPGATREAESFLDTCVRVPFAVPRWKSALDLVTYRAGLTVYDSIPDMYRPWASRAARAARQLLDSQGCAGEVLVTFGAPMSDHLVGLMLRRHYDIPWVAHFSDPWTDNPYKKQSPLARLINRWQERRVLEESDVAVFTSEDTLDLVMRKYSADVRSKGRVLPHAFESMAFPEGETAPEAPHLTLRYIGDFYGPRTPEPLFRALRRTIASEPAALADVRFEFIGRGKNPNWGATELNAIQPGLVSFVPPVDYGRSVALMRASDGLLVLDAPAARSVFLPSKLIEYVGAGRPIFGVTPPGAAATLIRRLGGWVADPRDVDAIAQQLADFVRFLHGQRLVRTPAWGDDRVRREFEASSVAARFERTLREALAARATKCGGARRSRTS